MFTWSLWVTARKGVKTDVQGLAIYITHRNETLFSSITPKAFSWCSETWPFCGIIHGSPLIVQPAFYCYWMSSTAKIRQQVTMSNASLVRATRLAQYAECYRALGISPFQDCVKLKFHSRWGDWWTHQFTYCVSFKCVPKFPLPILYQIW